MSSAPRRETSHAAQATGSVNGASPTSHQHRSSRNAGLIRTPSGLSTEVTALDFEARTVSVAAPADVDYGNSSPNGGESYASPVIPPTPVGTTSHRIPEELGTAATAAPPIPARLPGGKIWASRSKAGNNLSEGSSGDRRANSARRSTMNPAAMASAAENLGGHQVGGTAKDKIVATDPPSMVCALSYRGMEVVFATTGSPHRPIIGMCARTSLPFQTLDVPTKPSSPSGTANVVSMVGSPVTGMILVATADGTVRTYNPIKSNPAQSSMTDANPPVVTAFGRFKWIAGRIIRCRETFVHRGGNDSIPVFLRRCGNASLQTKGWGVDITSSADYKVLVAHGDQLAVFDASPTEMTVSEEMGLQPVPLSVPAVVEQEEAELLWTTQTNDPIVTAKISGDGRAIALVLEGEGVGVPYPYGVRTFLRDLHDGSTLSSTAPSSSDVAVSVTVSKHRRKASGSLPLSPPIPEHEDMYGKESSSDARVVYNAGPFLVHSASVTRLSFRGLGHSNSHVLELDPTSANGQDTDEGNDLLLTYCEEDCSVRVFSQNSWKQLMHWNTPPGSRADWVRGISAFNLGDLDPPDKKKKQSQPAATPGTSQPGSRRPSTTSNISAGPESSGSAGINQTLLGSRPFSALPAHPAPSSSAGAWIAELTFRNAHPALRLSRLSYMKSGDDDAHPAHFESVAAILPPGSLVSGGIMDNEDMGLCVQGIWPAWNPWASGASGMDTGGSLSGSAMALLGVPAVRAATAVGDGVGGSNPGGTHSPPSELRLVASHPLSGKVIIMEFPLWGDQDFGAMEFGCPMRYLVSLSQDKNEHESISRKEKDISPRHLPPTACLEYESHRLCARVDPRSKSVSLTWQKQGSLSILPASRSPHFTRSASMASLASSASLDSDESHDSFQTNQIDTDGPELFQDVSVTPLPLFLPPMRLPPNTCSSGKKRSVGTICALQWWPDDNFGGPPRLLTCTSSGTLILFEMPPPWSALEPPMPSYDLFQGSASAGSSLVGSDVGDDAIASEDSDDDSVEGGSRKEYNVLITPHPDFGIGLRLEAQADGMPAIAGSYKKHPLSGGRLPAERTGMIILGDELLSVNGVSLEGISFDEIIQAVRSIGAKSAPGEALEMKFRPVEASRRRGSVFESVVSGTTGGSAASSQGSRGRRSTQQIFGVGTKQRDSTSDGRDSSPASGDAGSTSEGDDEGSHATVLVGADAETQQEFGRVVAVVRKALPHMKDNVPNANAQSLLILLPWNHDRLQAAPPQDVIGTSLLVSASGRTISAGRLEVVKDVNPENARYGVLGSVVVFEEEGTGAKNENGTDERIDHSGSIRGLAYVKTSTAGWCVAAYNDRGDITLVFVSLVEVGRSSDFSSSSLTPRATLCQCPITRCGDKAPFAEDYLLRAASVELLAMMPRHDEGFETVTIWSALARPSYVGAGETQATAEEVGNWRVPENYIQTTVSIRSSKNEGKNNVEKNIIDFRFVPSGYLDAFPWLVTLSRKSAIVHRRSSGQLEWRAVAELLYPSLSGSTVFSHFADFPPNADPSNANKSYYEGTQSPADAFPHLIPALRNIITASDERNLLRSDWHPDSILAYICTEEKGVGVALKQNVRGIFSWLSRWMSPDEGARPSWNASLPLGIAPLRAVQDKTAPDHDESTEEEETEESAANLMAALSFTAAAKPKPPPTESEVLLFELQAALCPGNPAENVTKVKGEKRSKEFMLAMAHTNGSEKNGNKSKIPSPLSKLNRDELRFLWALGELLAAPPKLKRLDPPAQLCLFCAALMRKIKLARNQEEPEETRELKSLLSPSSITAPNSSVLVTQRSSVISDEPKQQPSAIASAGCLSALSSNSQQHLLLSCRIPNEMMDWLTARELRLPFWLRSDEVLKRIAEEIGQSIYKKTKDVMECALYFVASRNMRTLRNIAATDQHISGKKFFKFLLDHDFASDRGRKAAEKNAYSLLRKRKYAIAASFFLLAEPPMLKTALEVIVTQMEDLALAFLVARLVDTAPSASTDGRIGSLTIGGGGPLGLAKFMGGGAGFARSVMPSTPGAAPNAFDEPSDSVSYDDWKPSLGERARDLLISRGLPIANDDPCFKAVQLLWLSRHDDAACCLAGGDKSTDAIVPMSFDRPITKRHAPADVARNAFHDWATASPKASANDRVISKSNDLINFSSQPFLLKNLKASKRVLWSSTLLVSRALYWRGIELPSMRTLLQYTDPVDLNDDEEKEGQGTDDPPKSTETKATASVPVTHPSSIFDSFQVPPVSHPKPDVAASSIFDAFDAPRPAVKPVADKTPSASTSIFDSFDPPPASQQKSTPLPSGDAASSIFDSFDPAPQKVMPPKASTQASSSGQMESSIFDSFASPPPQKPKPALHSPQSGEMASPIFDSFTAAPSLKPVPPSGVSPASGLMNSSIFDSFDHAKPSMKDGRSQAPESVQKESNDVAVSPPLPIPPLWLHWRQNELAVSVARRLLREMARVVARFQGDALVAPMKFFRRHTHPLVPSGAAELLQHHCEGDALLSSVRRSLKQLCDECGLNKEAVVEQALLLLACPSQPRRIVFAVLLHCLIDRADLAEDVVRDAACDQVHRCETFAFGNDDLAYNRKTTNHVASQYLRRQVACVSWQLELCLWLYRGGTFPLCGIAVKETIVAVRVGLLIASWKRCHECLETMIRCEPDCQMDHDAGRQLWSSLKMISCFEETAKKCGGATSGGWEFLVDCKRDEAAQMLHGRKPGSFLIRPHSDDHGVFTLSFRTNLVPSIESRSDVECGVTNMDADGVGASQPLSDAGGKENVTSHAPKATNVRPVKRDDVVQHAILRLSDAGFRCGSFGPFTTLMKLLEAVSTSLPFDLLFNEPPIQGIIKDQGAQPSPNSFFFRKLALNSKRHHYRCSNSSLAERLDDDKADQLAAESTFSTEMDGDGASGDLIDQKGEKEKAEFSLFTRFGMFSELLALSQVRKQLSAVAAADYDDPMEEEATWERAASDVADLPLGAVSVDAGDIEDFEGSLSETSEALGVEELYEVASRVLRPLLCWCRMMEINIVHEMAPDLRGITETTASLPVSVAASETAIEAAPTDVGSCIDGGDAVIRRMIQPGSGVEFRTLRVGEGGHSAIIVLFSKSEAIPWLVSTGAEKDSTDAAARLQRMENRRVIEQIDLNKLSGGKTTFSLSPGGGGDQHAQEIRYRFVDPWEVEVLKTKAGEVMGALLGREHYLSFNIGLIAGSCEKILRSLGGLHLLGLWSASKGGIWLTKAIASVHPPWERDAGGDLQMKGGMVTEPSPYENSIRQHLYRNAIFRRLKVPQRFLALVQVELLDLKNLTSPGGSSTVTAYALLRLKRPGSGAPLTIKARTLDSASTNPKKISKSSGPNAPASWGSVVRFRFPLPEDVNCDGVSFDRDREALFKGAPSALQISVYEKKFMSDISLGGADVKLDSLCNGGQMEEWVPLRAGRDGIHWFARIRLTLRFELMCVEQDEVDGDSSDEKETYPSVALKKIQELSRAGGAHEDSKGFKKSNSTPDLLSYFESMVY